MDSPDGEGLYTFKRHAFKKARVASSEEEDDSDSDFDDVMDDEGDEVPKSSSSSSSSKRKQPLKKKQKKKKKKKMAEVIEAEDEESEVEALAPVVAVADDDDEAEEVLDVDAVDDAATQRRLRLLREAREAREKLAEAEMAEMSPVEKTKVVVDRGPELRVFVRARGEDKEEFRIRAGDAFSTLFDEFAKDRGVEVDACTFHFDGEQIEPLATPRQLDLEDEDMIDAEAPERRTNSKANRPSTPRAPPKGRPPPKEESTARKRQKITLVLESGRRDDKHVKIKVHTDDKFKKVFQHYAKIKKCDHDVSFAYAGNPLSPNQSPLDLGLSGSATIHASY
ncbi:hypothetical protein CTAYLR_004849 [Chrysophaeum taylorii]|uniref:Ubiquitin-like domain-containing protein n=1 Tax=Chrysophaeum taylorii TaxID=2483200 RepID=A0AAD7XPH5_9STRA|nr:hypothetical protein CTAYLR_004849 [Chrysophaeum taylorii]